MFRRLYDRVLIWAGHPHAERYMAGLSFAESSFFPIPPDVMLVPMCLAQPDRVWRLAAVCTVMSVLGGLAGYFIGSFAFEWIEDWLLQSSYAEVFHKTVTAFEKWGVWYILLAGFTPIPYKIFTIGAGVVGMPAIPFVIGSILGRGGRFFLVAGLIRLFGDRAAEHIRQWVDRIGWALLILLPLVYLLWRYLGAEQRGC